MTGNGKCIPPNTTYKNGDDWGIIFMALFHSKSTERRNSYKNSDIFGITKASITRFGMFPSFRAQLHSCLWVRTISHQRFSGKVSPLSQWPFGTCRPADVHVQGVNCRHGWGFSDEWIPTASRFVLNRSSSTNTWVSLIHFEYIYIYVCISKAFHFWGKQVWLNLAPNLVRVSLTYAHMQGQPHVFITLLWKKVKKEHT